MKNYKDEDYIHYVYKITNKTTGKYYIGIHSFPKESGYTPLTDGYWGSGSEITKDIRNLGRENFTKEIIGIYSTREEISNEEQKLVTIEVVRSKESYNLILGGDSKYESSMGWVICRPKSAIEKVIKITREEYYSNKELYVPIGHIKYYLETKDLTEEQLKERNERITKQRIDKKREKKYGNTNKNEKPKKFINKISLEIKSLKGESCYKEPYDIWYPYYFFDEVSNIFITKEYLISEYSKTPSIGGLSKKFKKNFKTLKKIIKYYGIEEEIKIYNGAKGHAQTKGFTGKTFVHNELEELIIKIEDLEKYLNLGYKKGRLVKVSQSFETVYKMYVSGIGIKYISKNLRISESKIKEILNLENGKLIWFHSNSLQKSCHFLIKDDNMLNDFIKNGWEVGRKVFKTL